MARGGTQPRGHQQQHVLTPNTVTASVLAGGAGWGLSLRSSGQHLDPNQTRLPPTAGKCSPSSSAHVKCKRRFPHVGACRLRALSLHHRTCRAHSQATSVPQGDVPWCQGEARLQDALANEPSWKAAWTQPGRPLRDSAQKLTNGETPGGCGERTHGAPRSPTRIPEPEASQSSVQAPEHGALDPDSDFKSPPAC